MIAIRPRLRAAAVVCLLLLAVSGCGLSEELDRERNPERRPTPTPSLEPPPMEVPSPPPEPAPGADVPVQSAQGCPPSGLRFAADEGDAAMGLRAMGLTVTNCSGDPVEVNGHPRVTVLDDEGEPFPEVRTVEGTDRVSMAPEDPGPEPFTLAPGESAHAGLYWRMHAQSGVYLDVALRKGGTTQTIRPPQPLDIGPDNVLGTTAWQPAE
ncbi:DUF4232 domain-containing protein [Streptomyces fructofermentans]|uniref:DUF4232 domain-containing protein n=1 Tax=Streptomyces fructofermentans TaxID=152141 RepID=UPI00378FADDE